MHLIPTPNTSPVRLGAFFHSIFIMRLLGARHCTVSEHHRTHPLKKNPFSPNHRNASPFPRAAQDHAPEAPPPHKGLSHWHATRTNVPLGLLPWHTASIPGSWTITRPGPTAQGGKPSDLTVPPQPVREEAGGAPLSAPRARPGARPRRPPPVPRRRRRRPARARTPHATLELEPGPTSPGSARPCPDPTNHHCLLPAPRRPGLPAPGGCPAGRLGLGLRDRHGKPDRGPGGRLRLRRRLLPPPLQLPLARGHDLRQADLGLAGVRDLPELLAAPAFGRCRRCSTSRSRAVAETPAPPETGRTEEPPAPGPRAASAGCAARDGRRPRRGRGGPGPGRWGGNPGSEKDEGSHEGPTSGSWQLGTGVGLGEGPW